MSVLERLAAWPSPLPASRLLPRLPRLDLPAVLALSLYVTRVHGFWAGALAAVAAVALTELAVRRPDWAVMLLLVSFAAAPRLDANLRAEDFVVLGLVLAALRKRGTIATPLDGPISLFASVLGLALVVGLASGTIARPATAAFTVMKILEYVIAFYAAAAVGADLDRPLTAAVAILAMAAIVQLIAWPGERPFDRWPYKAEANHVGGFAVLAATHFLSKRTILSVLLSAALVVATGSRIAMVALAVVCLLQHGRVALLLLVGLAAGAWFVQRERVASAPNEWRTFRETERRVAEGYPPVYSHTRNRVECWSMLSEDFARFPVIGTGPGSRDRVIYENAYAMLACETGSIGVLVFAVLLASIFASVPGARLATAAMLVLGLASISFFVAREAGVWWMLVGSAYFRESRTDRNLVQRS